ncbi:protein CreA [Aeromonas phage phiWae14]|nr:protein CreA [Aeromonas phage phiWae14]
MKKFIQGLMFVCAMLTIGAVKADTLYEVETSGLVFKDTLSVEVFTDPDYPNVTCYVNLPSRSLSFEDQTDVAMQCVSAPFESGVELTSRKNIFSQKKGLFFKSMVIDRVYDKEHMNMVYVSYTKKMDGDNASSAITVVPVL